MYKIALSILTLFVLLACSTSKKAASTMSEPNIERVKKDFPDYTMALYNEGKALYEQKCTMCHGLKSPDSKTADEWKYTVQRMVSKANKKTENINAGQEDLIIKYLTASSK